MKPPRSVWVRDDAVVWSIYVSDRPMGSGWTRYDLHRPKAKPRKRRKGAK